MSDFGHVYANIGGFHIDGWGAGPFILSVGGKTFRFEDSDRFGPYLVAKDGRVLEKQPSERSDFWGAHGAWVKQGRRLEEDGINCVWQPFKPTVATTKILGRKRVLQIVEQGEDGGDFIVDGKKVAMS